MKTIGINATWNYDKVVVLPQLDDDSLAKIKALLSDIGDCAYEQGYNDGFNDSKSGCISCAYEDVEEWEMPCAKCKRGCRDYWRAKT